MTDSMIPYSFIPGTKAKASEVNANFVTLADLIIQNKNLSSDQVQELSDEINETLSKKADKTELVTEHTVTTGGTNLNNYLTKGTYIFSSSVTPTNIPKGKAGVLIVLGEKGSELKHIWVCNGAYPEIFTREYINGAWGYWYPSLGMLQVSGTIGYIKFPNGLIIQWGEGCGPTITYPVAFTKTCAALYSKAGWSATLQKCDTGIQYEANTGFSVGTAMPFTTMNWIVIGI